MINAINGWTKAKILKHIEDNFKGKSYYTNEDGWEDNCAYRMEDGRKCAVGMFIPDKDYRPAMEGMSASAIVNDYELYDKMPFEGEDLNMFQEVHDKSKPQHAKRKLIKWIKENVV